jgi:hypothetical protein
VSTVSSIDRTVVTPSDSALGIGTLSVGTTDLGHQAGGHALRGEHLKEGISRPLMGASLRTLVTL